MKRTRGIGMVVGGLSAAVGVFASSGAMAAVGQHTTLASFQQNVRADVLLEPFNGAAQNFFTPYAVSGGGYSFGVNSPGGVRRDGNGMGALHDDLSTEFSFTGRPVTAFAGTLRVLNDSLVPIGGTVNITLSTGESFTVPVGLGGTFFGITSSQAITSLVIDSPLHSPPSSAATYEWIDDVYVGTSGTAAVAADQCGDAVTITPITSAQYPFTTVGATAEASPGVCDSAIDTGPDVWFRYVSPVHGTVTMDTCGCDFDSILRVYASCAAAPLGAQIACNDDFCAGGGVGFFRASQVSFRVLAGEDYLIRISGYNGASGSGALNVIVTEDCRTDFNHNGVVEVQDIFDYLNAWFAGCP